RRILREWDFWRWIALSLLFRRVLRVGVKDKSRLVRAGCGIEGELQVEDWKNKLRLVRSGCGIEGELQVEDWMDKSRLVRSG
ncbi:MAG: hypothetical protein KA981_06635, partial [Bacteroidia bacterium]|nr:hypothetical protein [Bacteroidia bacterium]